MIDVRLLMKFLDKDSVIKTLFSLLFLALFSVLDMWLLVFCCITFSSFYNLILATIIAVGLFEFLIIFGVIKLDLSEIKFMIKNGIFPEKQFNKLAGSFIGAWFSATPGILTSVVALFLMFPMIKTACGKSLTKHIRSDIEELYDYIKLYEVEI